MNRNFKLEKMKTIKSVTILLLLFIATCTVAFSQNGNEYKLALSSGKLYVQDLGDVEFSTSSSNEVIIVNKDHRSNQSDRARGLKLINGLGLDDNMEKPFTLRKLLMKLK